MTRRDPHDHLPLTPLSLAVLVAVAEAPQHGYAILKALETRPGPRLIGGAGSLYAALQRMVDEGLLRETDADGVDARRRRAFAMTPFGRAVARAEMQRLQDELRAGRESRLLPEGA
jgi:DNA-binding PadR family transcriptional regulator